MSEISAGNSVPSQPEQQPKNRLSKRDFLKVIAAIGLSVFIRGIKNPAQEDVEAAYSLLARNHARRLDKYVDPVESYPVGEWQRVSTFERSIKLFEDKPKSINGVPTQMILEEEGISNLVIGAYEYLNGVKRLLVRLSRHGLDDMFGQQDSKDPITIENPDQLGAISVDSIHSFSAWHDFGNLSAVQNFSSIDLGQVNQEIITQIERDLTIFMGDWIRNLGDETVVLATDIPNNEAVWWQLFVMQVSDPVGHEIFTDLDSLTLSAELTSAAVTASTAGDMIRNLFKGRMTRRDLLKIPWQIAKIGAISATTATLMKSVIEFYNSHRKVIQNIDTNLINHRVNLKVKEREPEDFLGRVETLIKRDPSEVSLYEVFITLRDLISSYKELFIAEDGAYCQAGRNDFMSVWGLNHDTKLGLFATTKEYVLDLISRFNQRFGEKIDLCFTQNSSNPSWQAKVRRSILWTAMAYKTKSTAEGRKIELADYWQFPELKKIFN